MSKKVSKEELRDLNRMIAGYPDGVSVKDLLNILDVAIPKRTLQYRLSGLVKAGLLKKVGSGRNSRYATTQVIGNELKTQPVALARPFSIQLSAEGKELQKLITAPMQQRRHASYRREFLDAYQPNQTFYLSTPILEKLAQLGSGTEKERPAGTYARKIYQRLLIDLAWNSSRLEGNTYSLLETEKLLETGEEVPGKNKMDAQMILNHKEAIEFIVDLAEELEINRYIILNIHGLLAYGLLLDPKACGKLRTLPVKIGRSVYHPTEVPQLIEECFQLILYKASKIKNPFEQSFFLMVHLPYLQPFLDVNKRVSRLAGNIPLIRENLSPISFIDVPQMEYTQGLLAIYELNRIELFRDIFVWAYERSALLYLANLEALGAPDPFKTRYRELIQHLIHEVVQQKMNKIEAAKKIQKFAKENVPLTDQNRFIEIVEIEASSLHEGNFARFRIKPSEFFQWQKQWQ